MSDKNDVETVIRKIKESGKSGTSIDEVIDIIDKQKASELKSLVIERLVEEERAKIEEAKKKHTPPSTEVSTNFLGYMMQMAQVDPKKAKEFLESLSEEDLAKLSMLSTSGKGEGINQFIPYLKSQGMSVKDTIELVKILQPQTPPQQINIGDIAKIFQAGIEAAKASQAPASQGMGIKEAFEFANTIVKPFYDQMGAKDKQLWDERVARLESQQINPIEFLKTIKENAKELGLTSGGGGSPEVQIELEKLRSSNTMELEKMRAEREQWNAKFVAEQQSEERKWKAIEGMMQGPVGNVLENMGGAAADKLRGEEGKSGVPKQPKPILVTCPQCKGKFYGSSDAKIVICPHCKTTLEATEEKKAPPNVPTEQPGGQTA